MCGNYSLDRDIVDLQLVGSTGYGELNGWGIFEHMIPLSFFFFLGETEGLRRVKLGLSLHLLGRTGRVYRKFLMIPHYSLFELGCVFYFYFWRSLQYSPRMLEHRDTTA